MNRHSRIERLLAVYRSLDADEHALVDRHLETCQACAARHMRYQQMDRAISALPDEWSAARRASPRGQTPPAWRLGLRGALSSSPGRVLAPIGVIAILVIGIWLVLAATTPFDPPVAGTPSVTPSASASPAETATRLARLDTCSGLTECATGHQAPDPGNQPTGMGKLTPTPAAASIGPAVVWATHVHHARIAP